MTIAFTPRQDLAINLIRILVVLIFFYTQTVCANLTGFSRLTPVKSDALDVLNLLIDFDQ